MQRRVLSAALLTLGVLLATALPAAAHARLEQKQVPASSTQDLTIAVPGEREGSLNASVEVLVPVELTEVTCGETPGWTCEADPEGEGGSTILRFDRGEDGDPETPLAFSARTPDEPVTLRLPTIQVYDDGTEVAWVQTQEGAERPAPSLEIVAADAPVTADTEAPETSHGDPATSEPAETEATTDDVVVTDAPDAAETDPTAGDSAEADAEPIADTGGSSPVLAIILAVVALGGVIAVFVRRGMSS